MAVDSWYCFFFFVLFLVCCKPRVRNEIIRWGPMGALVGGMPKQLDELRRGQDLTQTYDRAGCVGIDYIHIMFALYSSASFFVPNIPTVSRYSSGKGLAI